MDDMKLSEWKPEESLATAEAQEEFILAAIEDGSPAFIAQSLAVVARARGNPIAGAVWDGIAVGLKSSGCIPAAAAPFGRSPHHELAMA